jgi:hypothetical protein
MNIKLYIVGANTDDKGAQLEELATAILQKQGYINISTNAIYSGGSEIDAIAIHKNRLGVTEVEYPVICECKAHNKPINMNDWLKFIGKIYIERFKNPQTIGLMIALSGANGNVIGSYNELKKHQFIHLIANDDLVALLMSEYKLSSPNDIETNISQYTNKCIAEIGLVYYSKCIYWIVNFIDGGFTLLNHNTEALNEKELDDLLQLLYSNTTFADYIDIKAEYAAIIRRASIAKLALSILMDEMEALSFQELLTKTQDILLDSKDNINQDEFSAILAENRFIQNELNKYSLLPIDKIDFIEFYRYVFSNATPIRILSRQLYLRMINEQLLERICEIQCFIKIPNEKKSECLFLLQYSPTALSYAIEEDKAITRYRSPKGNTVAPNVDKGHTEWFMHKITNSFIQDYHSQMLHELYLKEYEITSISINLGLEIAQEKRDKIVINDRKELLLGRLGEEYNNQIILMGKLPEN